MTIQELAAELQKELLLRALANGLELDGSVVLVIPPGGAAECLVNLPLRVNAMANVAHTLRALADEVDTKAKQLRGEPKEPTS